jgi:hypothetical protein
MASFEEKEEIERCEQLIDNLQQANRIHFQVCQNAWEQMEVFRQSDSGNALINSYKQILDDSVKEMGQNTQEINSLILKINLLCEAIWDEIDNERKNLVDQI